MHFVLKTQDVIVCMNLRSGVRVYSDHLGALELMILAGLVSTTSWGKKKLEYICLRIEVEEKTSDTRTMRTDPCALTKSQNNPNSMLVYRVSWLPCK